MAKVSTATSVNLGSEDSLSSLSPHRKLHRIFGLGYKSPAHFVESQWPCPPVLYLFYSVFWMLYIPTWAVLEGVINFHLKFKSEPWRQATFFIYLTNWTYIILSLLAVLRGIAVCWYYNKLRKKEFQDEAVFSERTMPTMFKIIWVFHNVALPGQVMVGMAYYFHAVFLGAMDRTTPLSDPMNINIHGIGTLYVILDLIISAMPLKPGHVIHVLFYALLYSAFTGIYFTCGGLNKSGNPWIYRVIDWREPRTILLVAGAAVVVTPLVWFALYGYYRLKMFTAERCKRRDNCFTCVPEMVKNNEKQDKDCDNAEKSFDLLREEKSSHFV